MMVLSLLLKDLRSRTCTGRQYGTVSTDIMFEGKFNVCADTNEADVITSELRASADGPF